MWGPIRRLLAAVRFKRRAEDERGVAEPRRLSVSEGMKIHERIAKRHAASFEKLARGEKRRRRPPPTDH